jgi:hypothetical protein
MLPKQEVPIACTLAPRERAAQIERIKHLTRGALRSARRDALALHLTYSSEAAAQVRDLVRVESSCCAFLDFDLREDAQGVQLTITSPERARDVAQVLFDQFAPRNPVASR